MEKEKENCVCVAVCMRATVMLHGSNIYNCVFSLPPWNKKLSDRTPFLFHLRYFSSHSVGRFLFIRPIITHPMLNGSLSVRAVRASFHSLCWPRSLSLFVGSVLVEYALPVVTQSYPFANARLFSFESTRLWPSHQSKECPPSPPFHCHRRRLCSLSSLPSFVIVYDSATTYKTQKTTSGPFWLWPVPSLSAPLIHIAVGLYGAQANEI